MGQPRFPGRKCISPKGPTRNHPEIWGTTPNSEYWWENIVQSRKGLCLGGLICYARNDLHFKSTCLDVATWKVQSNHQPYLHCEFKILETARNNFKNSLLQTKLLLSVLHNIISLIKHHLHSSSRFTSLTHVALQKRSKPSRCTRGPHVPPATIHSSTLAWQILQDFAGRNSWRFGYWGPKAGEIMRNSINQHRQCLASVPVFAALKRPTKTPTSVAFFRPLHSRRNEDCEWHNGQGLTNNVEKTEENCDQNGSRCSRILRY